MEFQCGFPSGHESKILLIFQEQSNVWGQILRWLGVPRQLCGWYKIVLQLTWILKIWEDLIIGRSLNLYIIHTYAQIKVEQRKKIDGYMQNVLLSDFWQSCLDRDAATSVTFTEGAKNGNLLPGFLNWLVVQLNRGQNSDFFLFLQTNMKIETAMYYLSCPETECKICKGFPGN